jgi:hypothetical protein
MFDPQAIRSACLFAFMTDGRRMAIRTVMIAMTTRSSTNVNPLARDMTTSRFRLPPHFDAQVVVIRVYIPIKHPILAASPIDGIPR